MDEIFAMEKFLDDDLNFAATVRYFIFNLRLHFLELHSDRSALLTGGLFGDQSQLQRSREKATAALLRLLMTNTVASQLNFDGSGEKQCFSTTKLWEVIQDKH